jgi:hypothetical protein
MAMKSATPKITNSVIFLALSTGRISVTVKKTLNDEPPN